MLGMILLKQHQKNLCVGLVSSHWTKSGLIYSKHFTQTSTVTSSHEHSDLKETSFLFFYREGNQAQRETACP